jgi:hypothetical protein
MKRLCPVTVGGALVLAVLTSCSGPTATAVGESNDLVVVRDPEGVGRAAGFLVNIMESEVPWLLDEKSFQTTVTEPSAFQTVSGRRHLILIGTWGGRGVEGLVRDRVSGVTSSQPPRLRIARDVWAKGQVVGIIMGADEESILSYLAANKNAILEEFEEAAMDALVKNQRLRAETAGTSSTLEGRYGWSICPPTDYDFLSGNAKDGFVFFRRVRPDRSIFVSWQPGDASLVSESFAVARRQELTRRYYDGDEIETRRGIDAKAVEFAGRPAVRISGWWANRRLVGGGPFRTYCFYEPPQGRIYLVDVSLFAPAQDKVPLMRNLDAIARSFRVAEPAAR